MCLSRPPQSHSEFCKALAEPRVIHDVDAPSPSWKDSDELFGIELDRECLSFSCR